MDELIIVTTTLPNRAIALAIAKTLVEEKYGACVQILANISSTYMWEGKLFTELEELLIIKTLSSKYSALEIKLRSIHPYTEPEIIAVSAIAASASYLEWVTSSLKV